jgi:histidine triad (HIT) family protein
VEGVERLQDCIFCQIVQGRIPADLVYEDESILAFKDIRPVAPVHILLITKKHIPSLSDVDNDEDARLIGKLHRAAVSAAGRAGVLGSGFRLVANCGKDAGQLVDHLHYHLLAGRSLQWPPG